jgi:hypothetical protein
MGANDEPLVTQETEVLASASERDIPTRAGVAREPVNVSCCSGHRIDKNRIPKMLGARCLARFQAVQQYDPGWSRPEQGSVLPCIRAALAAQAPNACVPHLSDQGALYHMNLLCTILVSSLSFD